MSQLKRTEAVARRSPRSLFLGEGGETLVEVIVAVSLVGLALVGITGAVSTSLTAATRLSSGEQLQTVLQQGIAETLASQYVLSSGSCPASYVPAARMGATFTCTITQITDKLQRIVLSATDGANSRSQTIFKSDR